MVMEEALELPKPPLTVSFREASGAEESCLAMSGTWLPAWLRPTMLTSPPPLLCYLIQLSLCYFRSHVYVTLAAPTASDMHVPQEEPNCHTGCGQ